MPPFLNSTKRIDERESIWLRVKIKWLPQGLQARLLLTRLLLTTAFVLLWFLTTMAGLGAIAGCSPVRPPPPASTQPDRTAEDENSVPSDWRAYANEQLGISFRYPPDWLLAETVTAGGVYLSLSPAHGSPDVEHSPGAPLLQFRFSRAPAGTPPDADAVRQRVEQFDPRLPDLFYDPEGALDVFPYAAGGFGERDAGGAVTGWRGSVHSSEAVHEVLAFFAKGAPGVNGLLELIVLRPVAHADEAAAKAIFEQVLMSLSVMSVHEQQS